MVRSVFLLLLVTLPASVLCIPLAGQTGFAVRGGSLGPGIEIAHQFHSMLSVRAGGTYLPVNGIEVTVEDATTDVLFTLDAKLNSACLIADFMPIGGFLHLSAGLVRNALTVDAVGESTGDYKFGERTFTKSQIGTLSASLEYDSKIAPYAGIGFGNVANGGTIGLTFDAGVVFSGPLTVNLDGTGMLEPTADQDPLVQEALDGVEIYPVISLGLAIRP